METETVRSSASPGLGPAENAATSPLFPMAVPNLPESTIPDIPISSPEVEPDLILHTEDWQNAVPPVSNHENKCPLYFL